jgi:hypothetical protein
MHSNYFGPSGVLDSTWNKHPCRKAINTLLSRPTHVPNLVEPWVMKIMVNQFVTNMKNMWSDKARINKLFNHLLDVLLWIHLSPIRESKYKAYIAKKKEDGMKEKSSNTHTFTTAIPKDKISIINKSFNNKKRLFENEKKRMQEYIKKAEKYGVYASNCNTKAQEDHANQDVWIQQAQEAQEAQEKHCLNLKRAKRCQECIQTYGEKLEDEVGHLFPFGHPFNTYCYISLEQTGKRKH